MEVKDDSGVSVHTSHQDVEESSVIASSNPVVFQCSQCDAIVGDSTSWVSANKIMRTITLGRVTSKVGVKPEVQISQSSVDKGSYEVGSDQTSGTSDLADMLIVPSPEYLMAKVNRMEIVIVRLNERIMKLEACHGDQESKGKTVNNEHGDKNPGTCTVGETESVSSSDNLSTKPHAFSSCSETADGFDAGYGCSQRPDVLVARPLNEDNVADYSRGFEQHSNELNMINEDVERVLRRHGGSNFSGSRHVNARSLQNENVHDVLDETGNEAFFDSDNEENENVRQSQKSRNGRKDRREIMEMNQERFGNERSSEPSGKAVQVRSLESPKIGSKNSNLKIRGANNESLKTGFMSPNGRGSVSRNKSNMETWPSPRIERKGRESKKRKTFDDSLC